MKTKIHILMLSGLLAIVACKNESPKKSTEDQMPPRNEASTKTTNQEKSGNFNDHTTPIITDSDSLKVSWNLDNPERQQRLYKEFAMTPSQIAAYEKALNDFKASELDDPYEKLSAEERIDKEDGIMKRILNDDQYKKYRKWASDNDRRGI